MAIETGSLKKSKKNSGLTHKTKNKVYFLSFFFIFFLDNFWNFNVFRTLCNCFVTYAQSP